MDKKKLYEELINAFIDYQWFQDNPFPNPSDAIDAKQMHYARDFVFRNKVLSLVNGVMRVIEDCEKGAEK